MTQPLVLRDDPLPRVRRLTLNRPEKRNALSNDLRRELFALLHDADADPEISVIVIRGAGSSFCAGYDLAQNPKKNLPFHTALADGYWSRHVVEGWLDMWDYPTPIIGQVHGFCLAGGTELAAACDLVYVAQDATIGYPPVRTMSPPDMTWQPWLLGVRRGMEAVLTGDAMTGEEAATCGFANRAVPADELDSYVLDVAGRVAKVPLELLALNKRAIRRSLDVMGMRTAVRATADIQALGFHQPSSKQYMASLANGVTEALNARDGAFGDYRTERSAAGAGSIDD
jgi:enoyl-CoA hydratase